MSTVPLLKFEGNPPLDLRLEDLSPPQVMSGFPINTILFVCLVGNLLEWLIIIWFTICIPVLANPPNSAVFRYRKSRVVELPNSEVFVLFPLLASVCYNVWNIECLENLWGEYVRKWLNLLKIDDNSWQSKKNRAVVSMLRVPKGKRVRKTSEFGSSTTPKTSDIGRLPNSGFARTDPNMRKYLVWIWSFYYSLFQGTNLLWCTFLRRKEMMRQGMEHKKSHSKLLWV